MKTALSALGEQYVARGVERLLVIPGPADRRDESDLGPVVQVRAPRVGSGYRLILEPWRVIQVLEEFAPDAIELNDKFTLVPVTWWARRRGIGTTLLSHECLHDQMTMRTGLDTTTKVSIGLLNRILVRSVDRIVVTSGYARAEFESVAAAAGCPVHTIPLGVDLELFRPVPHRPEHLVPRLVQVGRLSREKSPELALQVAWELHRRGVRFHLDVYGDGPMLAELRSAAVGCPVTYHGHLEDRSLLARRIGEADLALSVCPGETFGLAVLEAMACGTPVLASTGSGAAELVSASSGLCASPTAQSLAGAAQRLLSAPLDRAAVRRHAELFGWARTASAMLALHNAGSPAPGPLEVEQVTAQQHPDQHGEGDTDGDCVRDTRQV